MQYTYVYMLGSVQSPGRYYTGLTVDLKSRLISHNSGNVRHTAKYRPWRIRTAVAFTDRSKAASFEKYLKSHSGRAFASKHF